MVEDTLTFCQDKIDGKLSKATSEFLASRIIDAKMKEDLQKLMSGELKE